LRLGEISTGSFVAFLVAFTAVLAPALQLSVSLEAALGALPMYKRLLPIFAAVSEADGERVDPGELLGAIELNHVSFSYSADGPPVLQDVSLQIEPGEQVAIVGP